MYILLGDGFFIFQNTWSIAFRYDTVDGGKVHYRCNKVKLAGPQCPAAIYVLYHSEKESVSLFRTDDEHDHSIAIPSTRGLAPEIRIAVEQIYEEGTWLDEFLLDEKTAKNFTAILGQVRPIYRVADNRCISIGSNRYAFKNIGPIYIISEKSLVFSQFLQNDFAKNLCRKEGVPKEF